MGWFDRAAAEAEAQRLEAQVADASARMRHHRDLGTAAMEEHDELSRRAQLIRALLNDGVLVNG